MSFVRTLDDIEKLGAPVVVATMVLTFGAIAFTLVREASAPAGATAPVAVPSYDAAEDQDQVPSRPAAPDLRPDDPALETVDARELLRQAAVRPSHIPN